MAEQNNHFFESSLKAAALVSRRLLVYVLAGGLVSIALGLVLTGGELFTAIRSFRSDTADYSLLRGIVTLLLAVLYWIVFPFLFFFSGKRAGLREAYNYLVKNQGGEVSRYLAGIYISLKESGGRPGKQAVDKAVNTYGNLPGILKSLIGFFIFDLSLFDHLAALEKSGGGKSREDLEAGVLKELKGPANRPQSPMQYFWLLFMVETGVYIVFRFFIMKHL